jgi:hypothetical protein
MFPMIYACSSLASSRRSERALATRQTMNQAYSRSVHFQFLWEAMACAVATHSSSASIESIRSSTQRD